MQNYTCTLATEAELHALAQRFANIVRKGTVIFLHGDLGAGKTSFVRGFLFALGYKGKVKSPTFTLLEPYQFAHQQIYHFDLYRIVDAEELHHIGISEYFTDESICFIEWPERGFPILPVADLDCYIEIVGNQRKFTMIAKTPRGEDIINIVQSA